jgi:hypothetical protein
MKGYIRTKISFLFFLSVFLIIAIPVSPAESGKPGTGFWGVLLDNAFLLTILFIFLSALFTAILEGYSKDRCLKDFHGFKILLELDKADKLIWGSLGLYPNGLILTYEDPYQDEEGHIETSYILYNDEWPGISGLYRCSDELDEKDLKRRREEILRTYQPSGFRKICRIMKNLLNKIKDAISKSIGIIVGQFKKASPGSAILKTQDKTITQIGKTFIEKSAAAYDSILESLIGKKVVVETIRNGKNLEIPGILKEYSASFLEILSVTRSMDFKIPIISDGPSSEYRNLEINIREGHLNISNRGKNTVKIISLLGEGFLQDISNEISPSSDMRLKIEESIPQDVKLHVSVSGDVDIILPRSHSRVRHGGLKEEFNWKAFFGLK